MKKINGLPTLAVGLTALVAFVLYRVFTYEGNTPLVWRVPIDLDIYTLACKDLRDGGLLYDAAYIGELPFTYPPFAGVLFKWLSLLSDNWLIGVWQIGTGVALFAVILLVLSNRSYKLTPLTVYVAFLLTLGTTAIEPVMGTLFFGQINVFLMLLCALDLLPRRWRLPGVGIGLAAGIKLTPAYMGLVLLFQRRWWAVVGCLATFIATVLVGYWIIPDANDFWTNAVFNSSRIGDHVNPGAMGLRSVLERHFGLAGGVGWLLAVFVTFCLTLAANLVATRRGNQALVFAFTGVSSCMVSPFAWFHHFVWVVPLAVVILLGANQWLGERLPGWVAALGSMVALCVCVMPWISAAFWFDASYHNLDDWASPQPLMSLIFPFAGGVYMFIYAVSGFWTLRRGGRHARV